MKPLTLDHVALWVADRDAVAEVLTGRLGLREIEHTERFTLLGCDARRGKITLFAAEGPRERGALRHIGLRVTSLPSGVPAELDAGEGLRFVLVEATTEVEYDLDHSALEVADPAAAADGWRQLGFEPAGDDRLEVGGAFLHLQAGSPARPERPLLNHLGVLVESVDDHLAEAGELGVEIEEVVDAANTRALFVRGPEGVRLEYIEHKSTFSLT